jgi:hypothetical protein
MSGANPARGWALPGGRSPVVLVTRVGTATGSRAAAAALACAASDSDRAALLIDLDADRARPSLIATVGARRLEERLAAHLSDVGIVSRGRFGQLVASADAEGLERIIAALPLVRESAAIVHLAPALMRPLLDEPRIRSTAALLRADLAADHALTALAARDLMSRGIRVAVLKRSPSWLAARAALLGALPAADVVLPGRMHERLLGAEDSKFRHCYDEEDEAEGDRQGNPRQEGSKLARAQWWKERRSKGRGRA